MSTNPLLCWQVGPVDPTLWLCQARPSARGGPASPGFSCGLGGQRFRPVVPRYRQRTMLTGRGPWRSVIVWTWLTGLLGLSNCAKQTVVKWQRSHMSTHAPQQLQMLLNLRNSPKPCCHLKTRESPDLASQRYRYRTMTLHSFILMYSTKMVIRLSADERELPPGLEASFANALAHFFNCQAKFAEFLSRIRCSSFTIKNDSRSA